MKPRLIINTEDKTEDHRSALDKHIDYFGGDRQEGEGISYTSMVQRNESLGDDWFSARWTAAKVSLGAGLKIQGCPFSMFKPKQAVGVLNHSHHTGLYNLDGSVNEEVWKEICTYMQEGHDGGLVLSKTRFDEFLSARRQQENATDKFGELVSNGEWSNYWGKFSVTDLGGEQFVTQQDLRDFFDDSSKPGMAVEERVRHGM